MDPKFNKNKSKIPLSVLVRIFNTSKTVHFAFGFIFSENSATIEFKK